MNINNTFKTALRALGRNKLRSALTSIGIIIGVSSVIVMIGIGNSARITVRDRVITFGTNGISVRVKNFQARGMTENDIDNLQKSYYQIKYITPYITQASRNTLAKYSNKNLHCSLIGVNNDYFKIKDNNLQAGRLFTDEDIASIAKVAIIGSSVKKELFGFEDPLMKTIIVNNIPLKVIGILDEYEEAFSGKDFNSIIIIPYTTTMARFFEGITKFGEIYVSALNENLVEETADILKKYLRRKYAIPAGKDDEFEIRTSKDKLKMADDISRALSILLAGIASISLLVGGVGIMNIMLVSVTERTREIGIRMAIGAKKTDIMIQFLFESVTLSSLGGIIGITLGLIIYYLITFFVQWPFIFSFVSIVISALFAAAVGIFFGYYPSKKASNLKPIEALRYE